VIDSGQLRSAAAAVGAAANFAGNLAGRPASAAPNPRSAAAAAARDAQLSPKLVAAAHQFEASLMAELLKPLSSGEGMGGGGIDGDDGEGGGGADAGGLADLASPGDGSGGALMSFGAEALAKAISDRGGLGIARRVLDSFERGKEFDGKANGKAAVAADSAPGEAAGGDPSHGPGAGKKIGKFNMNRSLLLK
jgi:hypothetical protein